MKKLKRILSLIMSAVMCAVMISVNGVTASAEIISGGDGSYSFDTETGALTLTNDTYNWRNNSSIDITAVKSVVISERITSIEVESFEGCTGLTSVTLPDSLTEIQEIAFSGCTSLTSVTFPANLKIIRESAFAGCSALSEIFLRAPQLPKFRSVLSAM